MLHNQAEHTTTTPITILPEGKECLPINNTPLRDTGTMGLVIFSFIIIAITFRYGYKYVADFTHHMFSVRKRQNAFEDHTMNETMMMITMITNSCIMSGVLFYIGINHIYPDFSLSNHLFKSIGLFSLYSGGVIILQLILYYTLGYVFSRSKEDTRLWIDGFKASQSIFGLLISPIVFIILLSPGSTYFMLTLAIILYFCSRLVFISKGFRIFFNNIPSCVYFILYLCTVEIVPIFLICSGAIYLSETIV